MFRRNECGPLRWSPDLPENDRMVASITCTLGTAEISSNRANKVGQQWRIPLRVSQFERWKLEKDCLIEELHRHSASARIIFDGESDTIWLAFVGYNQAAATAIVGKFLYMVSTLYLLDPATVEKTAS